MNPKTDHDMIVELYSAVCGLNGQDGLLRKYKTLSEDYYKFKRYALSVFYFLLGAGILTGSTLQALNLIK